MKSKFSHILIYQIQYVGTRVGGGRQRNGIGTERTTERIPRLQYRVPARTVRAVWLPARSAIVEYRSYGTHVWPYHGRLNCKTVLGHR
eukprot:SAG31_NODE_1777_length_7299_cov_60.190694_5_plen_88_part_00